MAECAPVPRHRLTVHGKLKYGVILTGLIMVVEVIGGLMSNSLALLSDAGHVFTDVIALSLSWYAVRQLERPSSVRMTFGYHRVGVIVAVVNTVSIFAIAAVIFYEAYRRWQEPPEVNSLLMSAVAVVGLAVNIFVAYWLHGEHPENINVRSAFWHVCGDALASVGVIVGGIIIMFTGWFVVDPILSALIGVTIALGAWRVFKEGMRVLLEAAPQQVNVAGMIDALTHIYGVREVHDVHVWSISPQIHAMSCHVLIDDLLTSQAGDIRQKVEDVLKSFHIEHSTLQMECEACGANDVFCKLVVGPAEKEHEHEHH